jgi:putative flavoprotein involved in K+ transport
MRRITTVVIGAGHAGLAMSRCLAERAIEHVVLERGEVANAWRTGRWDSLRLLTPNWQRRLPGFGDEGGDPDGFATVPETVAFIDRYARAISAPVRTGTRVTSVRRDDAGYLVRTDRGDWHARAVVIATGACSIPRLPGLADAVPASVRTLTPAAYRKPDQLEPGGVLVVGASATGVQLADEIHRSGRPVTLAVGEHIRAPRTYRGRDIQWWMDAAGVLDQRYDEVDDIVRARKVPSLQLVGSPERRTLDLNALIDIGVRIVGRLVGISHDKLQFSGSLRNCCALSDLKIARLLNAIDRWATDHGLDGEIEAPCRPAPTRVEEPPRLDLPLGRGEVRTIIWATGFRADYAWLEVPVLDRKGELRHDGGVVASPGLYVMGLPFLRRRKSALIDGAGDDARELGDHLLSWLHGRILQSAA